MLAQHAPVRQETSVRSKWVPTSTEPGVLADPVRKPLGLQRNKSVTDQKHVALLFAVGAAAVFIALKAAGDAQRVGSKLPGDSRHQQFCESIAHTRT